MPEQESLEIIDELSHKITVQILRKLKTKKKIGTLFLSGNYDCTGLSYTCGFNYSCDPKSVHHCKTWFWCAGVFTSAPDPQP